MKTNLAVWAMRFVLLCIVVVGRVYLKLLTVRDKVGNYIQENDPDW